MTQVLLIGLGGFAGTVARYGLSTWLQRVSASAFPFGTLSVNVIGCFVLGCVFSLAETRQMMRPEVRLALTIGFCGGFTTFSAFAHESLHLFHSGEVRIALLHMLASNVLGLLAVWCGYRLFHGEVS